MLWRPQKAFVGPQGESLDESFLLRAAAQHAIADKRIADIKGYAASYDKMDDLFLARGLTQRMFAIKGDTQTLKKEYFPRLAAAIGNKRAANFYQVDNRLTLMINLQLASAIPLMP